MVKSLNRSFISLIFLLFAIIVSLFINNRVLNDDIGLELCYSGYFSGGIPVSDHLFQHFFLTKIISILYTYLNNFNWYFYLHLFLLVLSFFTILNVLIDIKNKYYILVLVCILFFLEFISFTFTRISFYLTFSGFLFYLKYDKLEFRQLVFSFALVFLGSIVRPESGILALILFFVLFISDNNFKKKVSDKLILKQLIIIAILPLIIIITHHISNKENSKRFLVSNLNLTESKLYESANFDNEIFDVFDYARLKQFYFDERFTSKDVVNYVKSKKPKQNLKSQIYNSIDRLAFIFLNTRIYFFLFLIMFLQIFLKKDGLEKIKFLSAIVFFITFLFFLNTFFDLKVYKDRVMEPLFLSLIISSFIKDYIFESNIKRNIVLLILSIFTYILFTITINDKYVNQDKSFKKGINKVYNKIPKNEMIFDPSFFSLNVVYPGNVQIGNTENFIKYHILPIGWTQRSYSTKVLYSKKGVKSLDELLIKSNTSLIVDSSLLILWNNYGEKYLNRNLVPYDSVCINGGKSCYYLARFRSVL